ncbi:hypothetical protein M434DRAFT_231711 [Hypoxylon sp. CO27-5]|nr:hypothetical protein M434DRAFT_231711 [Hypoxylon sp. CO27-5]
MSNDEETPNLPDDVEDVEETEVKRVDSPVRPVTLAPLVWAWPEIKDAPEGYDYVKHNLHTLQSENGRQVFPKLPGLHDLIWLLANTKRREPIHAAEGPFHHANQNSWPCEQAINPRRGDDASQENARSEQPSVNDLTLIRYRQEVAMKLEHAAALFGQVLAGKYRKPIGRMRIQPVAEVPWVGRRTRGQLPNPRVYLQHNYGTLLDSEFIPQPGRIRDHNGHLTEWTPLIERYRVILRLSRGLMPKTTTHFQMERGKYPQLMAGVYTPLYRVPRLLELPPQDLPPVASLIEEVEAIEKKGSLDAGDRAHFFAVGVMNVGDAPNEDVAMVDACSTDRDGGPQRPRVKKLPSISEVFANDDFIKSGSYNQTLRTRTRAPASAPTSTPTPTPATTAPTTTPTTTVPASAGQPMSAKARGKQIARSNRVYKPMEKGESSRQGAGL